MKTRDLEWFPENADRNLFTTQVMKGVDIMHDGLDWKGGKKNNLRTLPKRRKDLSLSDLKQGLLASDRTILGRAITLVESNNAEHIKLAQELLAEILPHTGKSFRIGITGVPGAGKSTFIEAFGKYLTSIGKRVAVIAVDPSSSITGGSILGDKTRMEELARDKNAFIRPSPSGGTLGGVARKSRETILLCEAAGFDVILIETVGVGQSEVTVRSMSDFFLLIQLAAQGDDLQGIKKGVIELADGILVNKCDGNMVEKSMMKQAELKGVLYFLNSPTPNWLPFCETCSALEKKSIDSAWELMLHFKEKMNQTNYFEKRRSLQKKEWLQSVLEEELLRDFYGNEELYALFENYSEEVQKSPMPVTLAVQKLLQAYKGKDL